MSNIIITTSGAQMAASAGGALGPYFPIKYFIPLYDERIDPTIHSALDAGDGMEVMAVSASMSATDVVPIGTPIGNGSGYDISTVEGLYSVASELVSGSGSTKVVTGSINDVETFNLLDAESLQDVHTGSSFTLDGNQWTITDYVLSAASSSVVDLSSPTQSDLFSIDSYSPITLSSGTSTKGLFKCRLNNSVGDFKFNKIALYIQQVDSNGDDIGTPVLFAIAALNTPISKVTGNTNITNVEIDVQLEFSPNNEFSQTYFVTNDYWTKVPAVSGDGLYFDKDVMIHDGTIADWAPKARLHLMDSSKAQLRLGSSETNFIDLIVNEGSNGIFLSGDSYGISTYISAGEELKLEFRPSDANGNQATVFNNGVQINSRSGGVIPALMCNSFYVVSGSSVMDFNNGDAGLYETNVTTHFWRGTTVDPKNKDKILTLDGKGNKTFTFWSNTVDSGVGSNAAFPCISGNLNTCQVDFYNLGGQNRLRIAGNSITVSGDSLNLGIGTGTYYSISYGGDSITHTFLGTYFDLSNISLLTTTLSGDSSLQFRNSNSIIKSSSANTLLLQTTGSGSTISINGGSDIYLQSTNISLDAQITVDTDKHLYFRNTNTYIYSPNSSNLTVYASSSIVLSSPIVYLSSIAKLTSSALLPQSNNTYDLGSVSLKWKDIFATDLTLTNRKIQSGAEETAEVNVLTSGINPTGNSSYLSMDLDTVDGKNLVTITGDTFVDGDVIVIKKASAAATIHILDSVGNLYCGSDRDLTTNSRAVFQWDDSQDSWFLLSYEAN